MREKPSLPASFSRYKLRSLRPTAYGLEGPFDVGQLLLMLHHYLENHRTLLQREAELVGLLYGKRFELYQEILARRLVACFHEAHEPSEPLDQIHRELHCGGQRGYEYEWSPKTRSAGL